MSGSNGRTTMNLVNLNIGKRLGLGFGLVCLMLVCMIATSNMMLGRINTGTDEIVNNRMPRIEATGGVFGLNIVLVTVGLLRVGFLFVLLRLGLVLGRLDVGRL